MRRPFENFGDALAGLDDAGREQFLTRLELLGIIGRQHGKRCRVLDYRRNGSLQLGRQRHVIEFSTMTPAVGIADDRGAPDALVVHRDPRRLAPVLAGRLHQGLASLGSHCGGAADRLGGWPGR